MKITRGQLREVLQKTLSEGNPLFSSLSSDVQHDMRVILMDNFFEMMLKRGHTMQELQLAVMDALRHRLDAPSEEQGEP